MVNLHNWPRAQYHGSAREDIYAIYYHSHTIDVSIRTLSSITFIVIEIKQLLTRTFDMLQNSIFQVIEGRRHRLC